MRNFIRTPVATFLSILDPFWTTFGYFTGSGRYGLCRGAGPKRLSKNLKLAWKSPKTKKSNLPSKCAEFRQKSRGNFFFLFWTRFDPLLAILLVLGGTACVGEPDQKDLAKNLKFDRKSPKTKKNRTYHQNVRNFARSRVAIFFSILNPFWPTFGHFTSSGR